MKKLAAVNVPVLTITLIAITVGMVLSAFMLSRFILKIQHSTEKSITVKGVAEKEILSDLAAFRTSVTIKAQNRADGYLMLAKTADILKEKLDKLGFNDTMREEESISCTEMTRTVTTRVNGKETSSEVFDHYSLTYSLRIRTNDVRLVEKNAIKIYELAARKLNIHVTDPEYFISNPEQYKLELVDQASASAAERARTAAKQSGSQLGALMKARQGVIQITRPASTDSSDGGVYDTSSVQKVIRLVMTLEFALK